MQLAEQNLPPSAAFLEKVTPDLWTAGVGPTTKPSYPEEFKREVFAHWASAGQSQRQIATHFGVSENSLRE